MKIAIAGGTGLIGKQLETDLSSYGHEVYILSRSPKNNNHIKWNPVSEEIDLDGISDVQVIINLCGAGIADKRWTPERKKELEDSRIIPALFLAKITPELKDLQTYISASGITCFGFENIGRPYTEEDPYGEDYTSQLVKKWEETLQYFPESVNTVALRFGIVLSGEGGAIPRMVQPIKMGAGSALGSGDQIVQWLELSEISKVIEHILSNNLKGIYNVVQGNVTNGEFAKVLAKKLHKWVLPMNVPAFVMKALYGELSVVLLKGVEASSNKLEASGFSFGSKSLEQAISKLKL